MPTVKHPETFQGCCSSNGVSSLTILPKITVMNKEYQNILQELFPKTQDTNVLMICAFSNTMETMSQGKSHNEVALRLH